MKGKLGMSQLAWPAASRDVRTVEEIRAIQTDEALVMAAQANPAEFAALYVEDVDPIFRFCYRRLGNRVAAEDATSVVFERAIKALPRFTTGSFRAWLFSIAWNVVTDLHRRDRGEQNLDVAREVLDDRPGPEEVSIHNAEMTRIRTLLAQLTPDQRQIVELRLAGLTDAEIAQVLGKSHGSIRTTQYRALQRLRDLVAQQTTRAESRGETHHASR
jgi:RNA polymerase sigma-70 factor (ECF subfamily)